MSHRRDHQRRRNHEAVYCIVAVVGILAAGIMWLALKLYVWKSRPRPAKAATSDPAHRKG